MVKFRFQDFEIWRLAIEIGDDLFDTAHELEKKHLYKFSEQLRDAAMSMSNNIAEGSGSVSNKEFGYFLNVARKSTFEDANILMVLNRRKLISDDKLNILLDKLDRMQDDYKLQKKIITYPALCSLRHALCVIVALVT